MHGRLRYFSALVFAARSHRLGVKFYITHSLCSTIYFALPLPQTHKEGYFRFGRSRQKNPGRGGRESNPLHTVLETASLSSEHSPLNCLSFLALVTSLRGAAGHGYRQTTAARLPQIGGKGRTRTCANIAAIATVYALAV